jgi:hypothetical protein
MTILALRLWPVVVMPATKDARLRRAMGGMAALRKYADLLELLSRVAPHHT